MGHNLNPKEARGARGEELESLEHSLYNKIGIGYCQEKRQFVGPMDP